MTCDKKTWLLILVLIIGIVVGIGVYAVLSSGVHDQIRYCVVTEKAPLPIGPYSQAVRIDDLVFLSGQIGLDPQTGNLTDTAGRQTTQAMENLGAVLQQEGLGFSDVVQTKIYLTDMADWDTINDIYGSYFEGKYPARATVQVTGLPKGAKVEIEMVAKKSQ